MKTGRETKRREKNKETEAGNDCRSSKQGESGRAVQRLTEVSHKFKQDQSLALINVVIKLLGAS